MHNKLKGRVYKQLTKLPFSTHSHAGLAAHSEAVFLRCEGGHISVIAKVAGTTATYVEAHYGHIDDWMLKPAALQYFKIINNGLIVRL